MAPGRTEEIQHLVSDTFAPEDLTAALELLAAEGLLEDQGRDVPPAPARTRTPAQFLPRGGAGPGTGAGAIANRSGECDRHGSAWGGNRHGAGGGRRREPALCGSGRSAAIGSPTESAVSADAIQGSRGRKRSAARRRRWRRPSMQSPARSQWKPTMTWCGLLPVPISRSDASIRACRM